MNLRGLFRKKPPAWRVHGFSRFPDELTPGERPISPPVAEEPGDIDEPPPVRSRPTLVVDEGVTEGPAKEMYVLRITESRLVHTIRLTYEDGGWREHTPLTSESMDLAREMVPREGILRTDCPKSFAEEAYEVRR